MDLATPTSFLHFRHLAMGVHLTVIAGGPNTGVCGMMMLHVEPTDTFFHLLAGLEGDDVFGLDVDPFSGPWIASLAWLAFLHLENAEVSQFDPALFQERVDNGVEGLLDNLFGFQLRQAELFGYLLDDLFLGHRSVLPTEDQMMLKVGFDKCNNGME